MTQTAMSTLTDQMSAIVVSEYSASYAQVTDSINRLESILGVPTMSHNEKVLIADSLASLRKAQLKISIAIDESKPKAETA